MKMFQFNIHRISVQYCLKLAMTLFLILEAMSSSISTASVVHDLSQLKPIECPPQTVALSFSLGKASSQIKVQDIDKKIPRIDRVTLPDGTTNMRLDLCHVSASEFTLKRVLYLAHEFSPLQAFTESDAQFLKLDGLSEAVFGDYSKLLVLIKDKSDPESGIVIAGIVGISGSYLAATSVQFQNGESWRIANLSALVGTLELGDAFAQGKCKTGQKEGTHSFQLESAQLTFETCEFLGGGMTTGYEINRVTVKDSSSSLPPALRNIPKTLEGEALARALKYKWNHHNACDSFVLKMTDLNAIYAATTAPTAGCGASVDGAPVREMNGETFTLFQNTYGNRPQGVKKVEFSHYLFQTVGI